MKIAIIGYAHPFGEGMYYGAEREIYYLILEYMKRGHECTVFSVDGCNLPCEFQMVPDSPWREDEDIYLRAIRKWEYEKKIKFDVVQSYMSSGYLDLELRNNWTYCLEPFMGFTRFPENIIAYSNRMNEEHSGNGTVIHYGIPDEGYEEVLDHEGYVVWIGRMDPGKAPHIAIEVAKRAGKRIILMGPSYHYPYFVDNIWPHIDQDKVIWLRSVNDAIKKRVFSKAEAFLSTNWVGYHEMFGIVNIEALAAGVPVIGWAHKNEPSAMNFRGGEIIKHGVHGFINEYDSSGNSEEESIQNAVRFLGKIPSIDRTACQQLFKQKFTASIMADKHLRYYDILKEYGKVNNVTREI